MRETWVAMRDRAPARFLFEDAGSDAAVILVHGLGASADLMTSFVDRLADTGTAVGALELPGHGKTPQLRATPSLDVVGRWILDAAAAWAEGRPTVLVCHSLSSAAIASWVGNSDDLPDTLSLRGLALVSLPLTSRVPLALLPPLLTPHVELLLRNPIARSLYLRWYVTKITSSTDVRKELTRHLVEQTDAEHIRAWCRILHSARESLLDPSEIAMRLVRRRPATLVGDLHFLHGGKDRMFAWSAAARLAEIMGATFTLIPQAGHAVFHDAGDDLADKLRSWIDKVV